MDQLLAIARYTLREHFRTRVYLSVFIFGIILLAGGLVVSALAVKERLRMLTDIGLASIEFLGLLAMVFLTVSVVLKEIETRTLYLMLSHPLERWAYLGGRFVGTWLAIALGMLSMALLHLAILLAYGGSFELTYILTWLGALGKVTVMGSIALLLSLFSTSAPTAMIFTLFLWIMGYFSQELQFLGEKSANPLVKGVIWVFYHISPNLSFFTISDYVSVGQLPSASWYVWLLGYTVCYSGICLFLSQVLFSKREI